MSINDELKALHDLLIKYNPISKIYDTDAHKKLEIEYFVNVDWKQLKNNFFGTITYLYQHYCTNNNYEGLDADLSDEIADIYENMKILSNLKYDALLMIKTYLLLLFFSLTAKKESKMYMLLDADYGLKKRFSDTEWYFRGEFDFSWDFVPSIIRKSTFPGGVSVLDDDKVVELLEKKNFITKYKKIFGKDDLYNYLSFAQHSISYSPFLDFSSSPYVALSFACEHRKTDGAIYALKANLDANIEKEKESRRIIIIHSKKFDIYTFIGDKEIYNCSWLDFEPKIRIRNVKSNDRMKYQKGIFVDIYNGIFIENKLLFPIGSENIIKFKIEGNHKYFGKTKIYNFIKKNYPQYELKLLYKPYDFFK